MQEERFAAAGIEKERVAPFEPCDGLALARLLGEQVADGFLLERLGRRRSHVDFLGVRPRIAEQPRMHHMVVEHDVGGAETSQTARGNQTRVARSGANQIDDAMERPS